MCKNCFQELYLIKHEKEDNHIPIICRAFINRSLLGRQKRSQKPAPTSKTEQRLHGRPDRQEKGDIEFQDRIRRRIRAAVWSVPAAFRYPDRNPKFRSAGGSDIR